MLRPNAACPPCHRACHMAEGDETERLAHQPGDLEQRRPSLAPAALAHHAVLLDHPAEAGEQQGHRVICHFLDEGVRAVGHGDAARGRRGDIDAVDADAAERDHLALRQAVDDRLGDLDALGIQRVGVARGGDEARFVGRAFDDLGVDAREAFHLIVVAAAGGGEAGPGGGDDPELCHGVSLCFLSVAAGVRAPPSHSPRRPSRACPTARTRHARSPARCRRSRRATGRCRCRSP